MSVEVSDAVGGGAETCPIGRVLFESRQALIGLLPALIDVAVVKMVAGIIGGDVRVHPKTLAFHSRDGIGRSNVAERRVKNRIVNTGREAGIKLIPEGAALHVVAEFSHWPELAGVDIPKMIGIEDVVGDVFGGGSKIQLALL